VAAAAESFLHGTVGSRAARGGVLLLHGARCMRSLPKIFEARAVRFQIFVLRCETFAWRAFFCWRARRPGFIAAKRLDCLSAPSI